MFKQTLGAPIAICSVLMVLALAMQMVAGVEKTAICHATSDDGHYNYLNLPPEPLSAHFDEFGSPLAGHEKDFFPVDNDCDKSNDPGGPGGEPGAVPEPVTVLLFGVGVAGLGYASRKLRNRKQRLG